MFYTLGGNQGLTSSIDFSCSHACKLLLLKSNKTKFQHSPVNVKRIKISHSLIAVGAVEVRIPLYLGHN